MAERTRVARAILQLFSFPQRHWIDRIGAIDAAAGGIRAVFTLPSAAMTARGYSVDTAVEDRVIYPLSMAALYALCPGAAIPYPHLGVERPAELLQGIDLSYPELTFRARSALRTDTEYPVELRVAQARTEGRAVRVIFSIDEPAGGIVSILLRPHRRHTRRA